MSDREREYYTTNEATLIGALGHELPMTKIKSAQVYLVAADGGITEITLRGDNLVSELNQPVPEVAEPPTFTGTKRPLRKIGLAGGLTISHVEAAEMKYTAPERPKSLFELGDLVHLTPSLLPPNTPFCKRGRVLQVKSVRWLEYSKCWEYDLNNRGHNDVALTITESDEFRRLAKKVDLWPYRRGDFVTFADSLGMPQADTYRLVRRVTPQDDLQRYDESDQGPAWWVEREYDYPLTWLAESKMKLVDVVVEKTTKWKRK
jgi:hypothetical protein